MARKRVVKGDAGIAEGDASIAAEGKKGRPAGAPAEMSVTKPVEIPAVTTAAAPGLSSASRSRVDVTRSGADISAAHDPVDSPALAHGADTATEDSFIRALRPRNFEEYVGQGNVISSLKVAVQAAKQREEAVDHVLFHGPPGLGKTTLAHIIARELGVKLTHTSGPALERPVDMVGLLSNLEAGEVLFIDEIHRLSHAVEEYLYSAMEDFVVDFVTGKGAYSRTLSFPLKRFTLVGATTRAGMLSAPLRDRFGMVYHLDYYSPEELTRVVVRSAQILAVQIDRDGASEIARRSRGVPRVANRLLRRVRDYAEVKGNGTANLPIARKALEIEGVDELGLDRLDRQYLSTLAVQYRGGPAGIEAIAATINEDSQTLVDVVEPFLLKIGFIIRTPQGRKATPEGLSHLGVSSMADADDRKQGTLGL